MPGLGGCEGEEKAVVVGDIFSDPELDVAGSLGSVSVQIWMLILRFVPRIAASCGERGADRVESKRS
jgi:hypothetical protein